MKNLLFTLLFLPLFTCGQNFFMWHGESCTELPTVTTDTMYYSTPSYATWFSNLISYGTNCTVSETGMCYGTSANPTISGGHTASGVTTLGAQSGLASGLTLCQTYHYRVYATNSYGTAYGADKTFENGRINIGDHVYACEGSSAALTMTCNGTYTLSLYAPSCSSGTVVIRVMNANYEDVGYETITGTWNGEFHFFTASGTLSIPLSNEYFVWVEHYI